MVTSWVELKEKKGRKKKKRKAGLLKTKEHGHKEKAGGVKEQEDAGAEELRAVANILCLFGKCWNVRNVLTSHTHTHTHTRAASPSTAAAAALISWNQ